MRIRLELAARWRRGQRGWPAGFPLVQFPNAPLIAALGGWLVAAPTHGTLHAYARAAFYAGLAAWAWEEVVSAATSHALSAKSSGAFGNCATGKLAGQPRWPRRQRFSSAFRFATGATVAVSPGEFSIHPWE